MKDLQNKVVLVTGATRGIGRAIAIEFAKNGAQVAFTYVSSDDKAKALEAELQAFGVKAQAYKSDAGDFKAADELVNSVVAAFGTIDVLVNNAGIIKDNLIDKMPEEDFDAVVNVNLKGTWLMCKEAAKYMRVQNSGKIVNIASRAWLGNRGQSNYAASKAGIIGFSKSVALELGSRNIRCNAVAPGFIETEMTAALDEKMIQQWREGIPLKRGGTPEDVANLTLFLASDASAYITGQCINVCGGMLT